MFTSVDEQFHEPEPGEHWQESFYFNWADADDGSFGLARIGHNWAKGKIDGLLLTMRDGQPEFIYPGIGIDVVGDGRAPVEYGVRANHLVFTMREPFARWNITLFGNDQVELNWTALNEPHDFHDGLRSLGASEADLSGAAAHFEQVGQVEGRVRINGKERRIEGFGHRDKSWGKRDWNGIRGWEWLTAHFGPDLGFNATLASADGQDVPAGFVWRDGENRSLLSVEVDYEWTWLKHVPKRARIRFTDERGERYEVRATALAQFPLFKNGLFIQETHARFEIMVDGIHRAGVGVLEHAWHAGTRGLLERWHQFVPVAIVGARQRLPLP